MLIFDIETNGLLKELTAVHILCIRDTKTGEVTRYRKNDTEDTIAAGLERLMVATGSLMDETIGGHNVIKFDIPAIQKVYPWFKVTEDRVVDTLVLARAIYPDLTEIDAKLFRKGKLPGNLRKRHSLEAWGHRLGVHKGDFKGPWDVWTQEMEDYCAQDTEVTAKLVDTLMHGKSGKLWFEPQPVDAIRLEHEVAWIIARQERHGFLFDIEKAAKLYSMLTQKRLALEAKLREVFPPFYLRTGELVPKADNKRLGYTKGAAFTKVALTEFNPGSRDHITLALKRRYGWEPDEFTNDGKAKVDETILDSLDYPEAKQLAEYFTVLKRLGQIASGKEAWLKQVTAKGRIHGEVTTNGAVTGRMTHARPNMAQVPASRSPYGHECRELFMVPKGKVLVGADADALELRCLAAYMARYDGGAYIRTVLEGKKEDGTDIHSENARALGLDPKATYLGGSSGRDLAKTWFYAFIYGAGNEKLGLILTGKKGPVAKKAGARSRASFMRNLPALDKLIKAVHAAVEKRGHLRGLDGRVLPVRSLHAALNTLLQSAGAVLMKRALVILDNNLKATGYLPGINFEFVANVHDEWQIESDEDKGDDVGRQACAAIPLAGEYYQFRCPLAGAFAVGHTWADTH